MNYKGKDVSLFQYNTKVAIPFVVSSKNYGIYWDNYSLSKFGDHREYKSLAHLRLYNKEGKAGGLTGEYLYKADPSKSFVVREDSTIDYEFLSSLKNFPKEFKVNEGIVRWEGFIESDYAGIHKFLITYAGYAKIWIAEKMVADHWRQAWNPGTLRFHLDLEKGKKYPIKIEWNPDGGESYLSVKWLEADPKEQNKLSFYSEAGDCIDYYVIAGKNMDDVISGYRTLTGKAPIFPKWAMGLWQSRERYKTQDELLSVGLVLLETRSMGKPTVR
jgi:alpha-D-xyloside xylohydrolase